jgi:hypothetical protein
MPVFMAGAVPGLLVPTLVAAVIVGLIGAGLGYINSPGTGRD